MQSVVEQAAKEGVDSKHPVGPIEVEPPSLPPLPFAIQSAPPSRSKRKTDAAPKRPSRHAKPAPAQKVPLAPPVDPALLVERLLVTLRSPTYRPPLLPSVAVELLELSRKSDIPYSSIRTLLEKDPLVAARVLRIAQSPAFATRTPIQSLQDALLRLGLKNLTHIFVEAALHLRVFRSPKFEKAMNLLRHHSTATAYAARIVCRFTAQRDDFAFLCGLLHDVGVAAALVVIGDGLVGPPPPLEQVWPAVEKVREEASGLLLTTWKLPEELHTVVTRSHRVNVVEPNYGIVAAVAIADRVAASLGYGFEGAPSDEAFAEACRVLGVSEVTLQLVTEEAKEATKDLV